MEAQVLVLDPGYQPVTRISWQRAMVLWATNKVEIIEEYEDKVLRTVTFTIRMPSVIRFLRAIRGKRKVIKFSRNNIHLRDKGACQYCGVKVPLSEYTYDHVTPRAQGGKTTWENIATCCMPCNQRKSGRTPEQAGMRLRSTPVRPTKLPELRVTITWSASMPEVWRSYLYWNTALDER